ncbi:MULTISPECIES: hypothetical protein [Aerococcus]|uniref:hypothetical protein n=1 Tax=Aerococcus TaxID=1375 RepID=UPI000DCCC939|nr:hypothetical protein [Aerococcus urinae]RAV94336.1 hypothetical protein DBT53_05880 [Aerococcus mictus]MDK6375323.1 hypothetical protein [Aerococcus urinae]MDK6420171.1 hypothetical protein [Aerococcus urinae]MDK8075664.1 hypothetical protein [Aerococcus urinae]MDK8084567.1 hypothetical protein [Aerococcus urinae]
MIDPLEYRKANSEAMLATAKRVGFEEGRKAAIMSGYKEGIEIGRKEILQSVVPKLVASGMTSIQIAEMLEKPLEEIEKFLKISEDSNQ